ncbi:MAG: nicotinate (nicotinamide) nucleotide adenylyltransferase [Synechococcales cyanobacterium C42_A2020_086]|jgi:nicotinate-nucleotide adenylyltransferase|nr:nicotinate (nicotinamide) nucleotide adenylyltransferase [Synechococcales cyanobacterium C42_A2020_086]
MQKLGIFGGAFNPVHWGHLLIAETALTQLSLDRVIWVPSYNPPHKATSGLLADFHHRLSMVEQAIATHPQFALSPLEEEHPGWSYALDTLRALQHRWGKNQWYWITGLDAFRSLPRWYGRRTLIRECYWLIAPRLANASTPALELLESSSSDRLSGSMSDSMADSSTMSCLRSKSQDWVHQVEQDLLSELPADARLHWQWLDMPLIQISSSLVRHYCRQQRSIRYLVPESVRHYILTHELYRSTKGQNDAS